MSIKVTLLAPKGVLERVILSPSSHFEQEWIGTPIPWVVEWLEAYQKGIEKPVRIDELVFPNPFYKQVNTALLNIPMGETLTYAELGEKIGCKGPRAVGRALGQNPYPLLLPCHRIVPKSGGVGGFAFGPAMKEELLAFEKGLFGVRRLVSAFP